MSDKEKAAREWEQSFDVVDIDLRGELERAVLGYIFDWAGFEAVVLKAIEAVKTATYLGYVAGAEWATPKWIRCSERLPEDSGSYLASRFKGDRGSSLDYSAEFKGWNLAFKGGRENELFPSHWQPLPEAPKEES